MVKRIYIIIGVLLFLGCSKKLFDLTMSKTPYTGDELRIDGYYYSNLTLDNDLGIAVFYRDGFCIHTWLSPEDKDTLGYIENEYLNNNDFIYKLKSIPCLSVA